MGMGGLIKPSEKLKEQESEIKVSGNEDDTMPKVVSRSTMPNWINFGRAATSDAVAQRHRKKSVAAVQQEEDDRHIRFTIGGVGQRMTKEGFIKQMQEFDQNTRREVVDRSTASHTVKSLAKQDNSLPDIVVSRPGRGTRDEGTAEGNRRPADKDVDGNNASGSDHGSSRHSSSSRVEIASSSRRGRAMPGPSNFADDNAETAVERRRRLAVLQSVGDGYDSDYGNDETKETPAERRRREAALGMSVQPAEDSDDDDTPRVPPARRGIRFADVPDRRA